MKRFSASALSRAAGVALLLVAMLALNASLGVAQSTDAPSMLPVNSKPNHKMETFVLIFRQGPQALAAADAARRQESFIAWARDVNATGHKLEPRILGPDVQRPAGDGGVGTDAWPINALLFIEAADLSEAVKIAAAHPAKNFNATVEVRPWAAPVPSATAAPVSR